LGEFFCISSIDDLSESIANSDLVDFLPQSESLAVRVKRVRQYMSGVDTQELARNTADLLLQRYDYDVDLESPDNEIIILLSQEKCVVSVVKAKIDRSSFVGRRPSERAFVHPSTLQPTFARAMVNLARTPRDGTFLDPFCGVGGLLLEAGLIGANPIGIDINQDLIDGAKENLEEAGVRNFNLITGDARDVEIDGVDAIATDPPYGRQASTGGTPTAELYKESLPNLVRMLREGGYLCITAPIEIDLLETAEAHPISLQERHRQRVHNSLTRDIFVFRREEK
jgi:tRNA (guanine10-N2)-dimethyltransferase